MKINIDIERLEKIFDDNMYLMEKAASFFDSVDDLGDWYVNACRVRVAIPTVIDEELMPDKLHLSMKVAGLKKSKRSGSELDIHVQKTYI